MNDDNIGLAFDSSPVERGVNKSVQSLDKLLAKLAQLEKFTYTLKNTTTTQLQGTLAATEKHNRSLLKSINELRLDALSAIQAGNTKELGYVAKLNKDIQSKYEQRLVLAGKISNEELKIWKDLGVNLGWLQKKQLKDQQAAEKTAAQASLANIKKLGTASQMLMAQKMADQKTEAQATLAHIKMLGGASARMMQQRLAAEKTAAQATLAEIKRVGNSWQALNRSQQAAEKQSAQATLASIRRIGAAWQQMHSQETAAKKAAFDSVASSAKSQAARATAGAAGTYSSLNTGQVIDPKSANTAGNALRKLGGDMNYAHSMARGLASGFGLLWLTWGSLAPLFIGAALSNGFVQTAKAGMEVAHTFATIEHLGENTREEMAALHDTLLDLARSGPFGPKEIAEAMKVLSLAGLKANEILAVTKDVLNFSVAGTTDLKTAAETLMTISTAFGMGAEGFGRVSDVISKAAAVSLSSVESIANAMKTASVINQQYGVSLEDTATAIAAMSKLGIQGTAAGTALRNMYADLSGRSVKVAKILKAQGIEMRDATGAMRPMIEVVAQLNSKLGDLEGISQKNLLQALLSERGAKGMIELLRLIRTEAKGAGDGLSNELERMRSEIADSAGFAAVTAAKMAQTTKSQFEALKATFGAAMEEAYQQMAPSLSLIFDSMKKTFASPEFIAGLTGMVTGIARVIQVLVEHGKGLATLALLYAGLKTAQFAATAVTSLIAAATERATAASAARAAALAVEATAEKANSAAKMAGVVGLARFIPGLNVAVGVLTAAWIAYEFWRSKSTDTDKAASELYNNNVIKDLKDQNDRLEQLNNLRRTGLSLQEAELRMQGAVDRSRSSSAIKEAKDRVVDAEVRYASTEGMSERSRAFERNRLQQERIKLAHERKRQLDAEMDLEAERSRMVKLSRERDKITESEVSSRAAAAQKFGTGTFDVEGTNSATKATNQYTASVNNNSAALEKQKDAEVASSQARLNSTLSILEAMQSAKMINEGAYERAVIEATEAHEAEKLQIIRSNNEKLTNEAARVHAELQTAAAIDVASSKLKADELAEFKEQRQKKLGEDLASLAEKTKAMIDGNNAEIEKIEQDSQTRRIRAAMAFEGKMKSLRKEAEDYRKKMAADSLAADEQEAFNQQWGKVGSNSTAEMQASKAAAEAALAATQRHRAELTRLKDEYTSVKTMYEAMKDSTNPEVQARAQSYKAAMEAAQQDITDMQIAAGEDVAKSSARAYRTAMQKENDRLTNGITDSIMTALVEGGHAGKKKLRDLLVEELKKPIRMYIDAFVNNIFGGGGAGGIGGGAGGNSWMDWAKTAYDWFAKSGSSTSTAIIASNAGTVNTTTMAGIEAASAGSTGVAAGSAGAGAGAGAGASAGAGAGAASAAGASSWIPIVGWIYAALTTASGLYDRGYNRQALKGQGRSTVYEGSLENFQYQLMESIGVTGKWTEIMTGATRMATLFGRRLKSFGLEANVGPGGSADVKNFEYYKGGLLRKNKTIRSEADPQDVQNLQREIKNTFESSKALARAMGMSDEAINGFTGSMRVNLKGVKNNQEAAQRYEEALQELQRQMLNTVDGIEMSKEEFKAFTESVQADMAAAGISAGGLADIITNGMMGRISASEAGDQMADMIVGGIYESIVSNYAGQIASVFTSQIIQPIFTAIAAGVPISQAISSTAIANIVKTAQDAAAALNAIFSNAEFREAMDQIGVAIGGVVNSISKVKVPKFGSAKTAAAQTAAENAAKERNQLETELLGLLGNTAKLRERELAALQASNRELQKQIWALQDAKTAVESSLAAVERAIDAQKQAVEKQLELAQDAQNLLSDIFETLRDNIRELRGEVTDTAKMQAEEARTTLLSIMGGTMPKDEEVVSEAIEALRKQLESSRFRTKVEKDRATLDLANFLASVQGTVQPKLTEAEQAIAQGEEQLAKLDAQLAVAQQQVDILFGIDNSVIAVSSAIANLNAAMGSYSSLVAAAAKIPISAVVTSSSSSSGSSYGGSYGGGSVHTPKPTGNSKEWTAKGYAAKNPDLVSHYNSDHTKKGWPSDLSSLDAYLAWHWKNYGSKPGEMRQYANGGYYPGGMAIVGEEGPEVINFRNPGQVYTAEESRSLQENAGNDDNSLVPLLLSKLEEANALNYAIASSNAQMLKIFKRVTRKGTSVEVSTEAPIQVSVV